MNRRQRLKRNKKLYIAIKELNDQVSKDLGMGEVSETGITVVYNRIKKNPQSVKLTLKHHKKYVLGEK